jgi:hypothetical protein
LPDDEIMRTVEKFKSYGYQPEKLTAATKTKGAAGKEKSLKARPDAKTKTGKAAKISKKK